MKNRMMIVVIIIGIYLHSNQAFAGIVNNEIDHTFNYQGELFDGITAADGLYDFTIVAYTTDSGNIVIGQSFERIKVNVTNGLFTINNVDLGDIIDGLAVYLQVSVKENGSGLAYEALFPRHQLQSVPYATTLTSGNASQDQVLTFNNGEWEPLDLPAAGGNSPWVSNGMDIYYSAGNVGIGEMNPTVALHVTSTAQTPAIFDGGAGSRVLFREEGLLKGAIGSPAALPDNDFSVQSALGDLHLIAGAFNDPSITVTFDGDVGINTTDPIADLHVEGTAGGDMFRVRIDGQTKLHVRANGGTSIGAFQTPPDNGLAIQGDIKQPSTSYGIMKHMVSISNCGSANVSISKSYNGVNDQPITVQNDADGIGTCEITFPQNVANRYILATEVTGSGGTGGGVSCAHAGAFEISCVVFDAAGNEAPGKIDVLIF